MARKARIVLAAAFGFVVVLAWTWSAPAQSINAQETLKQYVADLQKNPSDTALREKIIKLALEMKPAPTVPKEATDAMTSGAAAFTAAKSPEDFKNAAAEFGKGTLAAPWLADAYYNLGSAQEKAGLYPEAAASLRLYLLAAPGASDAKVVEAHINQIQPRGDLGAFVRSLDPALAKACGAEKGAYVNQVMPGGPADKAGIRAEDVIVQYGEKQIGSTDELIQAVGQTTPGTVVPVTVVRKGERKTVEVAIGQVPLEQYVAYLQKNPNDSALRERIIKLALALNPPPAIPEEARRHFVMAMTLFNDAKKPEDFSGSIDEFKSALLIAPWWPEANQHLGLALEAAQRYDEATSALKLYLATNPAEANARAAQDEIYKIDAKRQLAAKEKAEADKQAQLAGQDTAEDLKRRKSGLAALEGIWREVEANGIPDVLNTQQRHMVFRIQGSEIVVTSVMDVDEPGVRGRKGDKEELMRFRLDGRRLDGHFCVLRAHGTLVEGMVNENFNDIQIHWHGNQGSEFSQRYRRFDKDN
jgi:membrane-associated protease RseP (regulator of RpoE activity)